MKNLLPLIADGTLVVILLLAAPAVLWRLKKNFWSNLPLVVMAGLTSLLVGKILSLLYQPAVARPFIELGAIPGAAYINNPGFPSDHALLATAAGVAAYMLTKNKALAIVLSLLILIMCVGRVVALVHTPLDIIGGVVAGFCGIFWYKKLT